MREKNFFKEKRNVIGLAILCTLLWGSAFPAVKIGYNLFQIKIYQTGSKVIFAGCRFFLAGILTLIIACFIVNIKEEYKRVRIRDVIVLGFIQTTIQYLFFYLGLSNTTGSKSAIMTGTGTFLIVILAHIFLKNDKMDLRRLVGCLIGFIGIVVINYSSDNFFNISIKGEGFLFFSTIAFAIGTIISKGYSNRQNPILLTSYQMVFGGLLLIIAGFIIGGRIAHISLLGCILFLYLALLSAVAFTIWTILIRYNSVGKISIYNALTPIFGTLLSGIFLGDQIFNEKSIIALLCVSSGIIIVNKSISN